MDIEKPWSDTDEPKLKMTSFLNIAESQRK